MSNNSSQHRHGMKRRRTVPVKDLSEKPQRYRGFAEVKANGGRGGDGGGGSGGGTWPDALLHAAKTSSQPPYRLSLCLSLPPAIVLCRTPLHSFQALDKMASDAKPLPFVYQFAAGAVAGISEVCNPRQLCLCVRNGLRC